MLTMEIILKALDIIYESRLWKDRPPSHTLKTLLYLYNKGWLYIPIENNKIKAVIGAYRIPDTNKDRLEKIPVVEQGKILYIPFVVSTSKEDNIYRVIRESLKSYLSNNIGIEEIVLEGKDDKLRRFKIGDSNGKIKEPRTPSPTNV